jgi:hypothetical protein
MSVSQRAAGYIGSLNSKSLVPRLQVLAGLLFRRFLLPCELPQLRLHFIGKVVKGRWAGSCRKLATVRCANRISI